MTDLKNTQQEPQDDQTVHAAESGEAPSLPQSQRLTSRRMMFRGGLPAALGIIAAACGKVVVSQKDRAKQPPSGNDINSRGEMGNGNGNGNANGNGNGNNTAAATNPEATTPLVPPAASPGPIVVGTPGDMAVLPGSCSPFNLMEVDFQAFTSDAALVSAKALYGTRSSALLALAFAGVQAGGFVHVCSKASAAATKGSILVSRRFDANDIGKATLFDNLKLQNVQFLEILVSSGNTKKRFSLGSADADFVTSYMNKPVIDVLSIVTSPDAAFGASMPHIDFGDAVNHFKTPNSQRHTSSLTTDRPFQVAQDSSTWGSVPAGLTNVANFVTDALGNKITVTNAILASHHVFIVYVPKGTDKFFRYFFYVG